MSRVDFEAGNEFSNPMAAVTAPEPQDAPEVETQTPADGDDAPVESTWDDKPTNPDDAPESDETAAQAATTAAATAVEFEIKGAKGVHKFKLDPNDEQLQKTLKMGLGAAKWQRERDEARRELAKLKPDATAATEKAQVWDELERLAKGGHRDRVARAVLGDEGYAELVKEIVRETIGYEQATPDERARMDQDRARKEREWQDNTHQRQKKSLEDKYQALEDKIETDRLRSLGTAALQRHDFTGYVADKDVANAMNNKLWRLAWSDLEDMSDQGQDITPESIQRVFAANAKVLRAGQSKAVNEKVAKVIEDKKVAAKAKAQVVATERYPTSQPDTSSWDGRSAKSLLRSLVKGR
jgi:hypothetical protein